MTGYTGFNTVKGDDASESAVNQSLDILDTVHVKNL